MDEQQRTIPILRSILFVPAIVERFVARAPETGADVVCLDVENSVPPAEKARAREMAAAAIDSMPRDGHAVFVRVNGLHTGLLEDDLLAVVRPGLDGIVLSKTHTAEIVRRMDHYLTLLERRQGMEAGDVSIIPLVESAEGILGAREIAEASPRLVGLYKSGLLKVDEMVTSTYRLEDINEGYQDMLDGKNIRGVIRYDEADW